MKPGRSKTDPRKNADQRRQTERTEGRSHSANLDTREERQEGARTHAIRIKYPQ